MSGDSLENKIYNQIVSLHDYTHIHNPRHFVDGEIFITKEEDSYRVTIMGQTTKTNLENTAPPKKGYIDRMRWFVNKLLYDESCQRESTEIVICPNSATEQLATTTWMQTYEHSSPLTIPGKPTNGWASREVTTLGPKNDHLSEKTINYFGQLLIGTSHEYKDD